MWQTRLKKWRFKVIKAELRNKIETFFQNLENSDDNTKQQANDFFQENELVQNLESNTEILSKLKNGDIAVNEIPSKLLIDEWFYNEVIKTMEEKVFEYFESVANSIPQTSQQYLKLKTKVENKLQQFRALMQEKRNSVLNTNSQQIQENLEIEKVESVNSVATEQTEEEQQRKEEINKIYESWVENYNNSNFNKKQKKLKNKKK